MVRSPRLHRSNPKLGRRPLPPTVVRAVVTLALGALFLWLLSARLADINWADVRTGLRQVPWTQWFAASLATAASFWAVGQYDAVLHRHFATGLPDRQTRRAGICAIAVSQTTGMGVITGAIVRWRMLPGQTLSQAVRLTIAVAVSFLVGWAVVTSVVLVALPAAPFKIAASLVLAMAVAGGALCVFARPNFVRLPNGFTLLQLSGLCAVDTFGAAFAFYLLCPNVLNLAFEQLLPMFLLALGAGLISGTPGGVGAFELTLLALLPAVPEPELLAAVLAWRMIYYALPALIGAGVAIRGAKPGQPVPSAPLFGSTSPLPCAQAGLIHQEQHQMLRSGADSWLCARTAHLLVALFDPNTPQSIADLANSAKAENRMPALYHASARMAVAARRLGFTNLRIAQEAWVCPATFDLVIASRAGLRRKLRRAHSAGVSVTTADHHSPIPWPQLDQIAADWARSHGGERGFSMGRYHRDYVRQQRLYVAWVQACPVAFVTFHQTRDDWALDLVRHSENPPDGVMHLLIHTAIADAARLGVARLSLAAVPDIVIGRRNGRMHRLITHLTRHKAAGLAQFKSSFAPNWRTVYLAVPRPALLPLVCTEIAREVFWPKPLSAPPCQPPAASFAHDHEEYGFASAQSTCHRQRE